MRCALTPRDAWLCFDGPRNFQEPLAVTWIAPPLLEIRYEPAWPFDPINIPHLETSLDNFRSQFIGVMEECIGEIFRPIGGIPMLAVFMEWLKP